MARVSNGDSSRRGRYPIDAYIRGLYGPKVTINLEIPPESVEDTYSANFDSKSLQGRSSPVFGYSNGGPREVSFSITVREDYVEGEEDIIDVINKFKSIEYPEYTNDEVVPPKVYVKIGDFINFTGICNNVGVTWERPYGRTSRDRTSFLQAEVSLSFNEVIEQGGDAKSASDIINEE